MARVLCACALVLVLVACGDDGSNAQPSGALTACMERPGELPRPPAGKLPCELIPPGLSLK